MINIVCLKWGAKYGPEYVNRLYSAVRRHTTKPFLFWCFTEDSQGLRQEILTAPLKYSDKLDSWWNKISLFSDDIPISLGEQIFYIDLDTLIVGNIDHMLTNEVPDIVVLRDFYHGIARTAGTVASGLMSWRHGQYSNIWNEFIKDPEGAVQQAHPHGDQWWVERNINAWYYWQDLFPNHVVSFKMHCRNGMPNDARIICYHGRPSIPESATRLTKDWKFTLRPQPWILQHWRD